MNNQSNWIKDEINRIINSSEEDIIKEYYARLGQRLDL